MSVRLAETLAERGAEYLDAGVSGGVAGAEAGTLKVMAGGDVATFERARPVLDLLGTRVWHCGAAGTGHAMKTVLNLAAQTKLMAEIESLTLGVKAGLDAHQVAEVLELGVWQHFLLGPRRAHPVPVRARARRQGLRCRHAPCGRARSAGSGDGCRGAGDARGARRRRGDADLMEFVGVMERWNDVRLDGGT